MSTPIDRLKSFFNVGYQKSGKKTSDKVFATKLVKNDKESTYARVKEVFPNTIQQLFDWWLNNTHDSAASWANRVQLYQDCDMIYYNSPLISRAVELIADEVVQADTNEQPITVEAKHKQKKFILDFFDKIKLYDFIRPTAVDIVQYGNAAWILSFDEKGVDEIIPTDIYQLKDRLEFTPYEVQEQIQHNQQFFNYRQSVHRIDQLIDMVTNKDNIASFFKKYLFGFQVGEYLLPPWRCLHFRNPTTKSPFAPFGVPVFIHSIAPYRQMDAAMTMQIIARQSSFPKEVYKLKFPDVMPYTEKMARAVEFIGEMQNSGINAVMKEPNSVGEVIITIDGLYDFDLQAPQIDLGKIDDISLLRDDLIISTQLPRSLIDPSDGAFGDSGVSLVEKWKPFARLVYRMQRILLQNISQLVKIHMLHSNAFSLEEIDFTLSMPYPESQVNREIIDSQKNLIDLANSVIDSLSDKFMGGEQIPYELKKQIYAKFLPYDDATLTKWMNEIEKAQKAAEPEPTEEEGLSRLIDQKVAKVKWEEQTKGKRQISESIIKDIILEVKQERLREGVINRKHYYSSKNQYSDLPAELLRELDIDKIKATKEDGSKKRFFELQEEYKFPKEKKLEEDQTEEETKEKIKEILEEEKQGKEEEYEFSSN